MKKYIGMFIIAAVCGSSVADVVTTATYTGRGLVPVHGDANDAFQNATITGGTTVYPGFFSDAVFTGNSEAGSENSAELIFVDGTGQWVPSVEFSIASPIQLGNIKILLNNDGGAGPVYNRTTVGAWVYASSTPGFLETEKIAEVFYDGNYSNIVGEHGMEVSIDFSTAPVAQYYRVAFYAGDPAVGARVIEIDGYEAIPEPATLGLVALFGGGIFWIRRTFMI